MTLNTRIFYDINDFARAVPWLQPIVAAYAAYGIVLFAVLLVAGWWIARKHADPRRVAAALWAPLGMLAAVAINQPVATAFAVTRPCQELRDIVVLHCNTDSGFPSDHAVMAGAVVAGLCLVSWRLGAVAAAAAAVMAFARVYVGAHYPDDVLAGLALGAAVSLGGYVLARPLLTRMLALLENGPLRILIAPAPAKVVSEHEKSR